MSTAKVLLVGLGPPQRRSIERGARLAGDVDAIAVDPEDSLVAASAGDPPAAAVISDAVYDPIRLARELARIDREMAITVLASPDREDALRQSLRFAPFVTANTTTRRTTENEQLGVDVVEAAHAAVRRRGHRAIVAASNRLNVEQASPALHGEALGRLVESAPIGVLTLDSSLGVAGFNRYAAEVLGVTGSAIVGRPVVELLAEEDHGRLTSLLRAAGADEHIRPELLGRLREGREQFLEVLAGPAYSAAGDRGVLVVLSDVTERILAERSRQRAEDAQAFLAETGALLDASLDPDETLQRIASLAVPLRADVCVIDRLEEDGVIRGAAVAATDPEVARRVVEIRRHSPVDPDGSHPVARVLRSGSGEVLEELDENVYRDIAQSPEHYELMRSIGYRSAVTAPLAARGRKFGAISLFSAGSGRTYSAADLRILEDVARRAALALDNARLYARERRIAETLQRSLLPARLPDIPGIALAAHYEPGEGDVGGDWYDVIALDRGRVACVVGDIVGRGIHAASVMGQLRNAVRVYALEHSGAADVVNAVDRLSDSLGIGHMATLVYIVCDPQAGVLEISAAGHPPPLVVEADGTSRYLMVGRSGPVGVGLAGQHVAAREPFAAGSTVLAYTDGLIERRGAPLDEGLDKLAEVAVAAGHVAADELAARVMSAMRPGGQADDVALLVLQGERASARLKLSLPADTASVRAVRAELKRWLGDRLPAEDVYDIVLACSEACANVVEHAYALRRGELEVEGDVSASESTIVVRDFGRWRAPRSSNRGRGTPLMETIMDDVSINSGESGTEVVMRRSFRVPVPA